MTKRLNPGQNGTKRYAQDYGERLVCVRYREDEGHRYTTVELVVDQRPVQRRKPPPPDLIPVVILHYEEDMRRRAVAAGARWDPAGRCFWISRAVAVELGLADREITGRVEAQRGVSARAPQEGGQRWERNGQR
ncbi:MAG: hypothetical protein AB2A00_42795 [Myxococcota bacterium]